MSHYTTEVRYICENAAGLTKSAGYDLVDDILENSWNKVIPFNFPIFDESYRAVLCKKILLHYYTREIGFETVGLWKLKMQTKLNEIMPYYNELYKTTIMQFNPFYDADYWKTHEGNSAGDNDSSTKGVNTDISSKKGNNTDTVEIDKRTEVDGTEASTGETKTANTTNEQHNDTDVNKHWDVYSDTPQGALVNVENETYLTNARKITDNDTNNGTVKTDFNGSDINTRANKTNNVTEETGGHTTTSDIDEVYTKAGNNQVDTKESFKNTDEYIEHIAGKMPGKTYMQLIKELRDNIINIDMMIIEELSSLFFLLWG